MPSDTRSAICAVHASTFRWPWFESRIRNLANATAFRGLLEESFGQVGPERPQGLDSAVHVFRRYSSSIRCHEGQQIDKLFLSFVETIGLQLDQSPQRSSFLKACKSLERPDQKSPGRPSIGVHAVDRGSLPEVS